MNKLMLIGLTLTALVFGCNKQAKNQDDCETEQKWDANTSTCVDRVYYTFTLRGDAEGKWAKTAVARITAQHTTNTLKQVGDCVKVEDSLLSSVVIEFVNVSTSVNEVSGLTAGHYDVTAEAGGASGFGVTVAEAMNSAENCVPLNEDVQHLEAAAPATPTEEQPAATEEQPAATEEQPAATEEQPAATPPSS